MIVEVLISLRGGWDYVPAGVYDDSKAPFPKLLEEELPHNNPHIRIISQTAVDDTPLSVVDVPKSDTLPDTAIDPVVPNFGEYDASLDEGASEGASSGDTSAECAAAGDTAAAGASAGDISAAGAPVVSPVITRPRVRK